MRTTVSTSSSAVATPTPTSTMRISRKRGDRLARTTPTPSATYSDAMNRALSGEAGQGTSRLTALGWTSASRRRRACAAASHRTARTHQGTARSAPSCGMRLRASTGMRQ